MRGRKPKPTYLRILEGNRSRRPLNENEPKVKAGLPEPPKFLMGEALAEWRRVADELVALGIMAKAYRAALAAYCQAWARWVEAEGHLKDEAMIYKTSTGYPVINPWWTVSNRAQEKMETFLTHFGLSPAAMSRIKGAENQAEDKKDPAARFFGS